MVATDLKKEIKICCYYYIIHIHIYLKQCLGIYQINTIKELKSYFIDNNIKNSNDLSGLGIDYWNNELKPLIDPELFEKPKNKEELKKLINQNQKGNLL